MNPRNGEWTEEATKIVLRLIDKSNINMYIMEIVGDLYLVDLLTTSKETCQLPTSIRDALIFLEYGCFEKGPSISSKVRASNDCTCSYVIYQNYSKFSLKQR